MGSSRQDLVQLVVIYVLKDGEIWWQGKGGMLTNQLRSRIRNMLNFEHPPDYLIIHVGANDLGSMSTSVIN